MRQVTAARVAAVYPLEVFHRFELFYSAHCLSCPAAREAVRRFASARPDVVVVEHEVETALELARRYSLIAVPALVIDGDAIVYGIPQPDALNRRLEATQPI